MSLRPGSLLLPLGLLRDRAGVLYVSSLHALSYITYVSTFVKKEKKKTLTSVTFALQGGGISATPIRTPIRTPGVAPTAVPVA